MWLQITFVLDCIKADTCLEESGTKTMAASLALTIMSHGVLSLIGVVFLMKLNKCCVNLVNCQQLS